MVVGFTAISPFVLVICWLHVARLELTIRYLDASDGVDTPNCLNNSNSACRSVHYAVSGSGLVNLELRVRPGVYHFNVSGVTLEKPMNVVIKGEPKSGQEVVFQCYNYSENTFNNFVISGGGNVTITDITMMLCGHRGSSIFMKNAQNIIIRNCTIR